MKYLKSIKDMWSGTDEISKHMLFKVLKENIKEHGYSHRISTSDGSIDWEWIGKIEKGEDVFLMRCHPWYRNRCRVEVRYEKAISEEEESKVVGKIQDVLKIARDSYTQLEERIG